MNYKTLFNYCRNENVEALTRAIEKKGADVNSLNDKGSTMLHWSARYGKLKSVEALIKLGADLEITDAIGNTPIISAALGRKIEIIKMLAENGANATAETTDGRGVLDIVAHLGTNSEVQKVMDAGIGIGLNDYPSDGISKFSYAMKHDHYGIAYAIAKSENSKRQMNSVMRKFKQYLEFGLRRKLDGFGDPWPAEFIACALIIAGDKAASYIKV